MTGSKNKPSDEEPLNGFRPVDADAGRDGLPNL